MKHTAFCRGKNGEYRACLKYSVLIVVEQIYKMKSLEVSGAVRLICGSFGVKRLMMSFIFIVAPCTSQSHLIGTPTNAHT